MRIRSSAGRPKGRRCGKPSHTVARATSWWWRGWTGLADRCGLIDLVGELEERGVGFRRLKESLDTTTAGGRLIFHVFGALAEFEREIIRERTVAGLGSARARGWRGGRPRALDDGKARPARRLKDDGEHSVEEICSMLGVGRSTLYRYLSQDGNDRGDPARPTSKDDGA